MARLAPVLIIMSMALLLHFVSAEAANDCEDDCLQECADVPPPRVNFCIQQCRRRCHPPADESSQNKHSCFVNQCSKLHSDKEQLAICLNNCSKS